MSNAEQFVKKFAERWGAPEPSRFVDLFHAEGTLLHPGMERPLTRDEVPSYVQRILSVFPDIRLEPISWSAQDDTLFIEWSATATVRGQRMQWNGVNRFTLRGDRAIEVVSAYDTLLLRAALDPSVNLAASAVAALAREEA